MNENGRLTNPREAAELAFFWREEAQLRQL
jgi:hypothetical protein